MSRGYLEKGAAWMDARIRVPSLSPQSRIVSFLIDTGATHTVLLPADAEELGIPLATLADDSRIAPVRTFGGNLSLFQTVAEVTLLDGSGDTQLLPMAVALPSAESWELPSVIGMSALRYFKLTLSVGENLVELERLP